MPNLEEFYGGYGEPFSADQIADLKALKRLYLIKLTSSPHQVIDNLPNLEYLILKNEDSVGRSLMESLDQPSVGGHHLLRKYKNTYIIFATIFDRVHLLNSDQLNILKPLFTTYTLAGQPFLSSIVAKSEIPTIIAIAFFIKEMGYDANGR